MINFFADLDPTFQDHILQFFKKYTNPGKINVKKLMNGNLETCEELFNRMKKLTERIEQKKIFDDCGDYMEVSIIEIGLDAIKI